MTKIPLLKLLNTSISNLENRAERLAPQLRHSARVRSAEVVEGVAYLGGGSVPTQELPTRCIAIEPADCSCDELAASLRTGSPAVFGRIRQDRLLLDLRTVFPGQDTLLVEAFNATSPTSNESAEVDDA